jgi:thiol-disulfide isomerase/thioredoxin
MAVPECAEDREPVSTDPHPANTLTGTITWTLDFDATAEAAGFYDCSYTRQYEGMIEDPRHPWLCPDCDRLYTGSGSVTEGYPCFQQIDDDPETKVEHFALSSADDSWVFWRSGTQNVSLRPLSDFGGEDFDLDHWPVAWEEDVELDAGGTFHLAAAGKLWPGFDEDLVVETPMAPRTQPYACGDWPLCDRGWRWGPWDLATGEPFSTLELGDACGEEVAVYDFEGRWLVIDASAPDCGPCQAMAADMEAWLSGMEARGYYVASITLMAESLSAINMPAAAEDLAAWAEAFGLRGPVLGDEGFAYATFPEYQGRESGMGFPTTVVVDPEMRVVGVVGGYAADVGFAEIEALITGGRAP